MTDYNEVNKLQVNFLMGFIRSGTTLLMALCRQHPEIETDIAEPNHIYKLSKGVHFNWDAYRKLRLPPDFVEKAFHEATGMFLKTYYYSICQRTRKRMVVIKHPYLTPNIKWIGAALPQSKILVLLRHPHDAIASSYHFTQTTPAAAKIWGKENLEKILKGYEIWMTTVLANAPMLQNQKRFMYLKFEDFLQNPHGFLKKIFMFYEVDSSDKMVTKILADAAKNQLSLSGITLHKSQFQKPKNKFVSVLNENQRNKVRNRMRVFVKTWYGGS